MNTATHINGMPSDTPMVWQPPGTAAGDQPTSSLPVVAAQSDGGNTGLAEGSVAAKSPAQESVAHLNFTDLQPSIYLGPINWPSKAQLLHLVWEKPATHIAKDLGCSQASVLMRAKSLGLPKPGHCYWQKKTAGIDLGVPTEVTALMATLDVEALLMKEAPPSDKARKRRPHVRRLPIAWPPKAQFLARIWAEPSTHIARELGCSYHAVLVHAKTLGLPTPGNGYWQKRTAGIDVEIPAEVTALMASLETPEKPDSPSLDSLAA
jgi:hypothetical protein